MKQNEQYYISTPNSVYMFNPSTFKEQSFYAYIKSKEKDDIAYHDVGEFTQEQYDFIINRLNNDVED